MIYFVAILKMKKVELNKVYREEHLKYLEELNKKGKVLAKGPFSDNEGGMVIYIVNSKKEAYELASRDPYVINGVRNLTLYEWKIEGEKIING